MTTQERILGTAEPLRALRSRLPGAGDESCGTFETGRRFLDWLSLTGQGAWQLLPLSLTHLEPDSASIRVPSPYKGYGVGFDPAYLSPEAMTLTPTADEIRVFRTAHADWIEDYALFVVLTRRHGSDDWTSWPEDERDRRPSVIARARAESTDAIEEIVIEQWRLERDFMRLKSKAKVLGIRLIGDLPFYVPLRSPLAWAHRGCFRLDRAGKIARFSGVPDGKKSHFGRQFWGHPLYRWTFLGFPRASTERLWRLRLSHHAALYDVVRIDHAVGFFFHGSMHPDDPARDRLVRGPGLRTLRRIVESARRDGLEVYAEDAGRKFAQLRAAFDRLRIPGIRIFRFAYNEKRSEISHLYADTGRYPADAYAFTTTHDTESLLGYVRLLTEDERKRLCGHIEIAYDPDPARLAAAFRLAVIRCPAAAAIIPLRDWLLTEDRINVPGTERPKGDLNWRYRCGVAVEDLPTDLPGRDA